MQVPEFFFGILIFASKHGQDEQGTGRELSYNHGRTIRETSTAQSLSITSSPDLTVSPILTRVPEPPFRWVRGADSASDQGTGCVPKQRTSSSSRLLSAGT